MGKLGLKQPVTQHTQAGEHRSTEHDGPAQGCAFNILNNVPPARVSSPIAESFAYRLNQVGPIVRVAVALGKVTESLARRGRPNEIEISRSARPIDRELQCIGLMELKRVTRLRRYIDADHFKAGAVQAHRRATRTAKQVESPWFCSHQHLVALIVCVR